MIEVENTDKTSSIYPSILDCSKALGVSRSTISNRIKTGNNLEGTNIYKIRKIPIFRNNSVDSNLKKKNNMRARDNKL